MEHAADIMLDPLGQAVVEGGMSCTLRDLARFGLAYLGDGTVAGRSVLPQSWVDDTRWADDENRRAFSANPEDVDPGPWSSYRNAWWIERPGDVLSGVGIFGQYCWVDRAADVVIARFSTYPTALPLPLGLETLHGFRAIADALVALA
jgi:CubicO group peptidase (beta-lactamase class C family)